MAFFDPALFNGAPPSTPRPMRSPQGNPFAAMGRGAPSQAIAQGLVSPSAGSTDPRFSFRPEPFAPPANQAAMFQNVLRNAFGMGMPFQGSSGGRQGGYLGGQAQAQPNFGNMLQALLLRQLVGQ